MKWIADQRSFDDAMSSAAGQSVLAIDTEADSLHSYFDKVCLIQMTANGDDLVIDPLSGIDLERFGDILADPNVTKILHGGDYDLRILNRDFGYTVTNLIDTMIAAQLLGYESFGLAALLERHFGVKVNKAHQRADWAMRPLTPEMLDYASMDTRYLVALADKLREELTALGRWEWAVEEFGRLEKIRFREADEDAEPFRKLKNIGNLDRRSLAILRDLHGWRDGLARSADRPPFKIIGNDTIIEIARAKPKSREELAAVKTMSRYHLDRFGRELLSIIRRAMDIPEEQLPERGESKAWIRDKALENRIDKLKKVRDRVAAGLKIDPSVIAPRHVLTAVATIQPKTAEELDQIPAMREWQKRLLAGPLLEALKPAPQNAKLF
ncbi:MAG TPA: ribonuclease D [Thermoanaerobaculia bacterium]|nr:ribonuclease D [Thermoanaerobaculia bacterium]